MYVYMDTCLYLFMYICIYIYIHGCMYVYMWIFSSTGGGFYSQAHYITKDPVILGSYVIRYHNAWKRPWLRGRTFRKHNPHRDSDSTNVDFLRLLDPPRPAEADPTT